MKVVVFVAFFWTSCLLGQSFHPPDYAKWTSVGAYVDDMGRVVVGLELETNSQFGVYQNRLFFSSPSGFEVEQFMGSETKKKVDPESGESVDVYDKASFFVLFKKSEATQAEPDFIQIAIRYTGCTDEICLFPYTENLTVPIEKEQDAALTDWKDQIQSERKGVIAPQKADAGQASEPFKDFSDGEMSFWMVLIFCFLGGLATNLTPCVAPMVPITLRVFAHDRDVKSGPFLYALGIFVTYLFLLFLAIFGLANTTTLLASPLVNLLFSGWMLIMGFSMLGFIDLSRLQRWGGSLESNATPRVRFFSMGLGFGLIAAPCTGPVLGALLLYLVKNPIVEQQLSWGAAYSLGLALPYAFLGMVPQLTRSLKIPVALQWFSKVFFGALMFALAFYYLRVPFYSGFSALPYEVFLGLAILSAIGVAILLAVLLRRVLETKIVSKWQELGFALVMGVFIFSAWISWTNVPVVSRIEWVKAKEQPFLAAPDIVQYVQGFDQPVLVDLWAEWCEACKKMERTTFADAEVARFIEEHFQPIKLDFTVLGEAQNAFIQQYGVAGLPTVLFIDGDRFELAVGYQSAADLKGKMRRFVDDL